MTVTFKTLGAALALAVAAGPALAQDIAVTYDFGGTFDDATFAVETAIIGKGLVIDHVSHTGDMLARTGADVGSDVVIFDGADVFSFCSATISREVMEANPLNVAFCPYNIFVYAREGAVTVGYRTYPDGEMQKVQALLDEIVQDAIEN